MDPLRPTCVRGGVQALSHWSGSFAAYPRRAIEFHRSLVLRLGPMGRRLVGLEVDPRSYMGPFREHVVISQAGGARRPPPPGGVKPFTLRVGP